MDIELLKDIFKLLGITGRELTVYLALLRYGRRPTSFVAGKTGLNRGTTYMTLHTLLKQGLVIMSSRSKVQYFACVDPSRLVELLDQRTEQAQSYKAKYLQVLPALQELVSPLTTKPRIEFLDGQEGARLALNTTLLARDKQLRAFLSIADICECVGADFFERYTQKRIRAGYQLQVIRTLEKDKLEWSRNPRSRDYVTRKSERRQVRYVGEDLAFPVTTYIFDNKIVMISSKEEGFALIVESDELAGMQRKLFELVWGSLARKK